MDSFKIGILDSVISTFSVYLDNVIVFYIAIMCIQLETFLGQWELSTGCLVAAFVGPFYSTLFSLYFWLGPPSSIVLPAWAIYIKFAVTVYNCLVTVAALCFAYGVLKDKSWPIGIYQNMWMYIIMAVVSILIAELIFIIVLHPNMYMESISLTLNILFLTGINIYFIMIIKSYKKEMSE